LELRDNLGGGSEDGATYKKEEVAADNPLETPCAQISRRDRCSEHHHIATAGLFAGRDTK